MNHLMSSYDLSYPDQPLHTVIILVPFQPAMSRFVRPSKYRHTFANQPRKEYCYEGVKVRIPRMSVAERPDPAML